MKSSVIETPLLATNTKSKKRKKPQASNSNRSVSKTLFEAYHNTEDILTKSALCYLLKNGSKIPTKEEDTEKFAKRRRQSEIKIERLTEQIASRIPQVLNRLPKRYQQQPKPNWVNPCLAR